MILYVSPIKARLNNQEQRLNRCFQLVGRRAALWHGDSTQGDKKRTLSTPESRGVMLVYGKLDHHQVFRDIRVVVIDEFHAFAGDYRGGTCCRCSRDARDWQAATSNGGLREISAPEVQRFE